MGGGNHTFASVSPKNSCTAIRLPPMKNRSMRRTQLLVPVFICTGMLANLLDSNHPAHNGVVPGRPLASG
jgi:hypothetical protein